MNRLIIPALLIGFGTALAAPHVSVSDTTTCHFAHWWSVACVTTQDPNAQPVGCEPVPGAPVRPTPSDMRTITVLPLPPEEDTGGTGG